jgi:hypothetical protein
MKVMMNNNNDLSFKQSNPFAEVVESCLENFVGQSWQWDFFPEFGSLVQVASNDITIVGCVFQVQTGSLDPMRYPFPYQKTEEELLREQPQIFEFLKTTFKVQILGYFNSTQPVSRVIYLLPPKPSKVHSFIANTSSNVNEIFFQSAEFINILFSFANQIPNLDELLLAIVQKLAHENLLTNKFMDDFSQQFSLLTGNDYRRLKLFLRRVENLI